MENLGLSFNKCMLMNFMGIDVVKEGRVSKRPKLSVGLCIILIIVNIFKSCKNPCLLVFGILKKNLGVN